MYNSFDPVDVVKEQDSTSNSPDFKIFINKILRKWWLFGISVFACLAAAFLIIRYSTPIYKISAKILIEDEKKGGGSINAEDLLGGMSSLLGTTSNIDNEVEILTTRKMAEKVVKRMDLNITYFRPGRVKNTQIYPAPFLVQIIGPIDSIKNTFFDFSLINDQTATISYFSGNSKEKIIENITFNRPFIIKEIGAIKIIKNPEANFYEKEYKFYITSIDIATAELQKSMGIGVTNKMVSTVDISVYHPLPKKGEHILDKFIQGYLELNLIEKNRIADSTIAFIDNRLDLVSSELGNIEEGIQTFKQTNQLADIPEQSKLLVANANTYEKELSNLKTQVSIIEALEEYLSDDSKSKSVVPSSIQLQDVVFSRLSENYNILLLDREKQLLTSTESNPYIKNLDQRISSLRKAMLSNLAGTKRSMKISLEELQRNLNLLGNQMRKVPAHERAYLGMFRQQTLKQELYLFLLQKREEVALSKTSNISSSKIIDDPKSESKPMKPNGMLILALGLLAGLAIPFAAIYLQDLLNDRVQNKEDITNVVSIPVIGEINKVKLDELFVKDNPKSIISEQFRALRSNLSFFFQNDKGFSILLTSSMQAEGKTFTVMNLGTILALSGKKVLLIDLDLRVASLSEKLDSKTKKGFTNYIISKDTKYSDIIYPSGLNENLFIMPSGVMPPNPAETLMDVRAEQLINKLKEEYDYIILDAPPVGLVADALLLKKYVSLTIYMVRQNHTFKSQLKNLKELSLSGKMGKMGVVFNDIRNTTAVGYGRYGYGLEPKPNSFKAMLNKLKKINS